MNIYLQIPTQMDSPSPRQNGLISSFEYWKMCDMIKRNELDVGNTVFEIKVKRGNKFFMLYIGLELQRIVHISATRCLIEIRFGSNVAF